MAAELSRFGLPYRIIDKSPEPAQWSQALVVQSRTLEQFERYGIAQAAVQRGRPIQEANIFSDHRQILSVPLHSIPSPFPYVLFLPQSETEKLLTEHLQEQGCTVERQVELTSFTERDNHVEALLRRADGSPETIQASYLVGCDGAHSTVRHVTSIAFEGKAVPVNFLLADIAVEGNPMGDQLRVYVKDGEVAFIARMSDDVYRIILALNQPADSGQDWETPLTTSDFQGPLDRIAGPGFRLRDPVWTSRYKVNERKARHYRSGRAFLAGDASHIHSPVAGQGMNTGIQDVANLAWKLAAVAHGSRESLLDTYEEERSAVGNALLAVTSRGLSAVTVKNPVVETVRDHLLQWFGGIPAIQNRLRGFVSETALGYRKSSIVLNRFDDGELQAGDRAPDISVRNADGKTEQLYAALKSPQPLSLLLGLAPERFHTLTSCWSGATVTAEPNGQYGAKPKIVLLRPDGYIGCLCAPDDRQSINQYADLIGLRGNETVSAEKGSERFASGAS